MVEEMREDVMSEAMEAEPVAATAEVGEAAVATNNASGAKIAPPHKGINPLKKQENMVGWLFCLPMIIGMAVFTAFPVIMSILSMFYKWDGFDFVTQSEFAGFNNFKEIFVISSKHPDASKFWQYGMVNTLIYMIQIPIGLLLGILLGLAMNRKMKGVQVFRILYYLPSVMSIVAVTLVFQKLFDNGANGYLNMLFKTQVPWLRTRGGLAFTVNFMMVWKGCGYTALMYIAGLQSVSPDQLEAARIDGANSWIIFWKITVPALYPITFYLLVTGIMGGFQVFNEPFILGGDGKYAVTAVSFIYSCFDGHELGIAAVAAWTLALIIIAITLIQMYIDSKTDKEA